MSDQAAYGVEMSRAEIAAFLQHHGHGVLSLGGDPPYGVPVSFGYDVVENRCVLQLLFGPDSRKREYVTEGTDVSLTAYEWERTDDWRSVVITGSLHAVPSGTPEALDAAEVFAPYATVVSVAVFGTPVEELEAEWYEVRIHEMSGRQSP